MCIRDRSTEPKVVSSNLSWRTRVSPPSHVALYTTATVSLPGRRLAVVPYFPQDRHEQGEAMRLDDLIRESTVTAPAIVVSGDEVALGVVRDLGRERVPALVVSPDKGNAAFRSRYCAPW